VVKELVEPARGHTGEKKQEKKPPAIATRQQTLG
jgi:hypothetical protein